MRPAVVVLTVMAMLQVIPARAAQPPSSRILTSAQTRTRIVALTFDDGPSPYTPQILTILHRAHVRATFFVIGREVAQNPGIARAEVRAGDEIGNHTYTHVDLQWVTNADIQDELGMTQSIVRRTTGVTPRWFRPPYDAVDARVSGIAASLGLQTVTWSVDPRDWSLPGAPAIVARVVANVRPGSIVLLHDGGGWRAETVWALAAIITQLRARGYRFVTLDEMFLPSPGCRARKCSYPS